MRPRIAAESGSRLASASPVSNFTVLRCASSITSQFINTAADFVGFDQILRTKENPRVLTRGFGFKSLAVSYSRMVLPHYHRR